MESTQTLPRVSIITVAFNAESYIEKTIISVLQQTYSSIEYIIVDGGSTDKTLEIIRRYVGRLTFVSEPDKGIYDAMNKGIRMATGDWINFLNGGDELYDAETLTNIFTDPCIQKSDFVYGDSINTALAFKKYITPTKLSKKTLRSGLGACHQAMFVRRVVAPQYNLEYRYKAEYNWVIDIFEKIVYERVAYIPQPVVYYALGGFSERGLLKNLREMIKLTRIRYGYWQVVKNMPQYLIILLRHYKFKLIGYGN